MDLWLIWRKGRSDYMTVSVDIGTWAFCIDCGQLANDGCFITLDAKIVGYRCGNCCVKKLLKEIYHEELKK